MREVPLISGASSVGAESKPILSQPLLFPPPKPSEGKYLEGSSGVQRLGVGDSQPSLCWAKVLYWQSRFMVLGSLKKISLAP